MSLVLDVSAGVNVKSGLGRYSRALTEAMLPLLNEPPLLFYNEIAGRTEVFPEAINLPQRKIKMGYKPWRMAVLVGQRTGIGFNRLIPSATLFHGMEHLLMPLKGVPSILTVHDLIFKIFPEHHKKLNYLYLNHAMPLFTKKADAIITISESSKRDLMKYYGILAEKIHVIYEAPAPHFVPPNPEKLTEVRQRYKLPEQYLLVVGTIEPRKNYGRLVKALMRLRETHKDLKLVVVGSKGWLYEDFFQTIADLKATPHVLFPGYVSDEDLPAIYASATITVMASIYEGFGLPVLEAMASGSPVACSNISSLPELGGTVAHYFDPYNIDEIISVLKNMLENESLRFKLRTQGIQHAQLFSWQTTAQCTINVYNQFEKR